nr:protease [Zea mays]
DWGGLFGQQHAHPLDSGGARLLLPSAALTCNTLMRESCLLGQLDEARILIDEMTSAALPFA